MQPLSAAHRMQQRPPSLEPSLCGRLPAIAASRVHERAMLEMQHSVRKLRSRLTAKDQGIQFSVENGLAVPAYLPAQDITGQGRSAANSARVSLSARMLRPSMSWKSWMSWMSCHLDAGAVRPGHAGHSGLAVSTSWRRERVAGGIDVDSLAVSYAESTDADRWRAYSR